MVSIRKISVLGRTYRNLKRYRQIIGILMKYGFGDLLERLKIDHYLESGLNLISKDIVSFEHHSRGERLCMLLEELGPAFIKFGQILSTRPDIMPADIIKELEKLQDEVNPFKYEDVKKIIEEEFSRDINQIFTFFDPKPLASASIGQVHRAEADGEIFAVKVQRPGIRKLVDIDIEIMLHLATLIENNIDEFKLHKPVDIVEEYARTIKKELDYTIEAINLERVGSSFLKDNTVYIPRVYHEYSGHKVLTMEFVDGIKVSEIEELEKEGLDRKKITEHGAGFVFKQIFEDGFFHADPHPGNIFVLDNNVVSPVDFGMTGSLDERTRYILLDIIDSIVKKDPSKTAKLLLKLGEYEKAPDNRIFENNIHDFMERHLFKPLKKMDIGEMLHDFTSIATKHGVRIPPGIFLMLKAFAAVEGVAQMLDPEFDLIDFAKPYILRAKLARFSPKKITEEVFEVISDSIEVIKILPGEILEIAKKTSENKLSFNVELTGLNKYMSVHDKVSNRLSFAIITAALIIGSALLLAFNTPPLIYGVSIVGIAGFSIAALFGIWLLIIIAKRGML